MKSVVGILLIMYISMLYSVLALSSGDCNFPTEPCCFANRTRLRITCELL